MTATALPTTNATTELVSDGTNLGTVQRKTSRVSGSGSGHGSDDKDSIIKDSTGRVIDKEAQIHAREVEKDEAEVEAARARRHALYHRVRPFLLGGLALLILAWWISATVLKATRHRWYVPFLLPSFLSSSRLFGLSETEGYSPRYLLSTHYLFTKTDEYRALTDYMRSPYPPQMFPPSLNLWYTTSRPPLLARRTTWTTPELTRLPLSLSGTTT